MVGDGQGGAALHCEPGGPAADGLRPSGRTGPEKPGGARHGPQPRCRDAARLATTGELRWPDHKLPGLLQGYAAARGDIGAAEIYAFDYYQEAMRHLGPVHPVTRAAASSVARSLYHKGDYASAAPIFRVILHAHEVQDGPQHPDTLTSVNNLAGCMQALGDAAAALPLYRRALESRERVLGAEHPDTLASVNGLAGCMAALGDAAGALPLNRRALESCEHVLGAEHPQTLTSVNNLAGCMYALGDAAGALPLYRRALESCERVLGAEHPQTLISVNNLAGCMAALGDAAGALPLYRRALESCERVLGAEHPQTLTSVNNLADCLDGLGHLDEAVPLYRRALEAQINKLGAEHPNVLLGHNRLSHRLRKAGHPGLAEPYAREEAETTTRVLGETQPLTVHRRNNLALTLLMRRETMEARRLLADNWAWPAPDCANTTPGIAFLGLLADLLDGGAGADAIARLKPLLLGPKLPTTAAVAYPWDVGYLLDYLAPRLPDQHHAFLTALLAAINDPAHAQALDRFPIWHTQRRLPGMRLGQSSWGKREPDRLPMQRPRREQPARAGHHRQCFRRPAPSRRSQASAEVRA